MIQHDIPISIARMCEEITDEQIIDALAGFNKLAAINAINDFTRIKMLEDGFFRRILPPLQITNDELDRAVSTDKPIKIIDKE